MRTRIQKGLIVTTAVFLAFATLSYAEGQKEGHKGVAVHSAMTRGHGGVTMQAGHPLTGHSRAGHHHWKDTLNKAQMEKMEAMHLGVRRDMAPLKAELEFKKAQLKNLVTVKSPNMAAVKGKIKEVTSIQAKMLTKRYSHIVEMRKVLTPAQRQSFDLDLLSGAEHWQGHKGHKGHSCDSGYSKGHH